jgi:hypothetical protein
MRRVHVLLLLSMSVMSVSAAWPRSAAADDGGFGPNLKGAYGFTGTAACLVAPGSSTGANNPTPGTPLPNSGFNAQLQPIDGKSFSHSFDVEGIRTFLGDGTGIVKGTAVTVTVPPTPGPAGSGYPTFPPAASTENFSYKFTYTVNGDGSWTSAMAPGSYAGSFASGPRTGQTYTVDAIPPISGMISLDGMTLIGAHLTTAVETHSFSNGDVWPMVCHRSRVFIKLQDLGGDGDGDGNYGNWH